MTIVTIWVRQRCRNRAGDGACGLPREQLFAKLVDYTILMPTMASVIRPFVDSLLIANGMSALPRQIETVSDAFGRAFLR